MTPESLSQKPKDKTLSTETGRRHAIEERDKNLEVVQELERKLGVTQRWHPGLPQWHSTASLIARREYQRCLDNLEGLVVARLFELTKINQSQTGVLHRGQCDATSYLPAGYKMRRHIAKALQTRSQAIRTAIDRYNAAASTLHPPRPSLEWNEIVEYSFLAEFDLLRDTRQDVRTRTWATPAGRHAMDLHFKMKRAEEEIARLDIEIRRFATYMRDEDHFLRCKEDKIRMFDQALAHQIYVRRMVRGRFLTTHLRRLHDISRLSGFTGTLEPGKSVAKLMPTHMPSDPAPSTVSMHPDQGDNSADQQLDEEEAEELELEEFRESFCHVLHISTD